MADIHVDDEKLRELLEKAVSKMLDEKQGEISELTSKFLDEATKMRRNALKDLEDAGETFRARAKERLTEADGQISIFNTALADKKKKVEEALNLRIIGGFTAVIIIAALGAIAFLGERIVAVNTKATELSTASTTLSKASDDLKQSIGAADEVYKKVAEAAKGTDPTAQLQTLSLLTTRMDGDIKTISSQIQKIDPDVKLLLKDYNARHSK